MRSFLACLFVTLAAAPAVSAPREAPEHNVVIFVADGLRYASVTKESAPTMYRLKSEGVDFANSHGLYPTLTTANASAIATGHYLGDTGDYANVLYTGFPVEAAGNSRTPFLENDAVLKDIKGRFGDGYMGPLTLLCTAEAAGYSVVVVGKLGPAAIQAIDCLERAIVVDDATNRPHSEEGAPTGAISVDPDLMKQIEQSTGAGQPPRVSVPNVAQQQYLLAATTGAILPRLKAHGKPFVLLFWSRDPDASQHGQDDRPGAVTPGINGPTAHAAIANADNDLRGLLDSLSALGLAQSTDVFVTADHGFSTIAKSVPDADGNVPPPSLPQGFLAIRVAGWLNATLFDPDAGDSPLDPSNGAHPVRGNGLIGTSPNAPQAVVAANGGTDFVYFPGDKARDHAKTVFARLLDEPCVGTLFVNDDLIKGGDAKDFAGALPLSAIRLMGSAKVPPPGIVVGFRSFAAKGCALGVELCAVEIADTSLQTGQGMHGSFSRADTRNFMAALGPDFRTHFVDTAPASNADIAPTLAHVMRVALSPGLVGRALTEALKGGKAVVAIRKTVASDPAANGVQTLLDEQLVGETPYFDAAGIPGRVVGLSKP